jgi:hypothetical protein
MDPQPVPQASIPAYPTRRDFLAGATAFAAATFGGSWRIFAASPTGGVTASPTMGGVSRGSLACIAIMPPVYHSEEEAMSLIREELSKAGIQIIQEELSKAGVQLKTAANITLPQSPQGGFAAASSKPSAKSIPVKVMDPSKNIAVEITTSSKFNTTAKNLGWSSGIDDWCCQFITIDVPPTPGGNSRDKIYLGVFRDPTEYQIAPGDRGASSSPASNKLTPEQSAIIHRQVKVFVDWLEEQKALY